MNYICRKTKAMKKYLLLLAVLLVGCEKEKVEQPGIQDGIPKVNVTNVGICSATLSGEFVISGEKDYNFQIGFEVSESSSFDDTSKKKFSAIYTNNNFSAVLDNQLKPEQRYFFRAYMVYEGVTYFSETLTFITGTPNVTTGDVVGPVTGREVTIVNSVKIGELNSTSIGSGLCISNIESNPTVADGMMIAKMNGNAFESNVKNLYDKNTYYYRAFISVKGKYYYGEVKTFTTQFVYNYTAVDLGLSVKWADMNVGALEAYEPGDYYAWGETKTYYLDYPTGRYSDNYIGYDWHFYFDNPSGDGVSFVKYYKDGGKTVLDPDDDVVRVNCGGNWRMPTVDEMRELISDDNCSWTLSNVNGMVGYVVRSRINGNEIFLPAGGACCWGRSMVSHKSADGIYYWTQTLCDDYDTAGWCLSKRENGPPYVYGWLRDCGCMVRGVLSYEAD